MFSKLFSAVADFGWDSILASAFFFYPGMVCRHRRHNFALSLCGLFFFLSADCRPAKESSDNALSIRCDRVTKLIFQLILFSVMFPFLFTSSFIMCSCIIPTRKYLPISCCAGVNTYFLYGIPLSQSTPKPYLVFSYF